MALPADVRQAALSQVEQFCNERVPEDLRAQVRLEHGVRGNAITIVERRPPWSELVGPEWTTTHIAQLRYDENGRRWSLYCRDSRERWWLYDDAEPAADVGPLLAAIDEDATGIFWG
jgi:Protein of unknown function (DUF3024)